MFQLTPYPGVPGNKGIHIRQFEFVVFSDEVHRLLQQFGSANNLAAMIYPLTEPTGSDEKFIS